MPDYPFIKEVVHEILQKYKGKGLLMVERSNMDDLVANLEYTHLKKKVVDSDAVDQRNLKIQELEKKRNQSLSKAKRKEYAR